MSGDKAEIRWNGGALRTLLLEDDWIIALDMEAKLQQLGCAPIHVAARRAQALRIVREATLDAAVLDVNVRGERSFDVADLLLDRGIPFVFATGYARDMLPDRFRDVPCISKPVIERELHAGLERALRSRR